MPQAFAVFNLGTRGGGGGGDTQASDRQLELLAKACRLDPGRLKAQWHDIAPRANSIATLQGLGNKEAWREALHRIKARASLRAAHPTDALNHALVAYAAFGLSSSGVEQAFSKRALAFSCRRLTATANTEEFASKAVLDLPHNDQTEVIALARKVWVHCYGPPKTVTMQRIDTGVKKRTSEAMSGDATAEVGIKRFRTEAAFLRSRRNATAAASQGVQLPGFDDAAEQVLVSGAWTDRHSKELRFQADKLHQRRVQAAHEHVLHDDQAAPELYDQAASTLAKQVRNERSRQNTLAQNEAAAIGSTAHDVLQRVRGQSVFVEPAADDSELGQALWRYRMRKVEAWQANVFIVSNPESPSHQVKWAAILRGAYVLHRDVLLKSAGVAVKYTAAACLKRSIYVSQGCHARSPGLWTFLEKVAEATPGNRWRWLRGTDMGRCLQAKSRDPANASVQGVFTRAELCHQDILRCSR